MKRGSSTAEHGNRTVFSTEFGKFVYFGVLLKIGILSDTEILYFEGQPSIHPTDIDIAQTRACYSAPL